MPFFNMPVPSAFAQHIRASDGALLYFFDTGTSTPKTTYTASDLLTPQAHPVVAGGDGLFAPIFVTGSYKVVLKDKNLVQSWDVDNVSNPGPMEWSGDFDASTNAGDYPVSGGQGEFYRVSAGFTLNSASGSHILNTYDFIVCNKDDATGIDADWNIIKGINTIIDEDSFVSNLPGKAPSQQSTKAYIASYSNTLTHFNGVEAISNLIAISAADRVSRPYAEVAGFYIATDGGWGRYRWSVSKSKTLHNGGTFIDPDIGVSPGATGWWTAPGSGIGIWELITVPTVKNFGAKGDDTNDDNEAIEAATTAVDCILVPAGIYLCYSITIPVNHTLYGEGSATTLKRLYPSGASETTMIVLNTFSVVRDMSFDGDKTSSPTWPTAHWGTAINITSKAYSRVENVTITDCARDGIYCLDSNNFTLKNINTLTNERVGIGVVGGCTNFVVENIKSIGDVIAGVDLEPEVDGDENADFVVNNVIADNCWFSVQGYSDSGINRNGAISNITCVGGNGFINFNKFKDLAVSGISCDAPASLLIETNFPTVFGRGVGKFSSVQIADANYDGVNQVVKPHFTSQPDNWWVAAVSGTGVVTHILDNEVGKYVANMKVSAGGAGDIAAYASPAMTVIAGEIITIGGMMKAVLGRPYINMLYKVAGATITGYDYKAAGGVTADGKWQPFVQYIVAPATCDNVKIVIGGAYDTLASDFEADFDGLFMYRNIFKTDAGPIDKTLYNSATYNPPSLAIGAGVTTTVACVGASLGDEVDASFSTPLASILMQAWVSATDVVSISFFNITLGVVDLASGTLSVQVKK